eukprot:1590224-Pyramimonas_sp.AAC.1
MLLALRLPRKVLMTFLGARRGWRSPNFGARVGAFKLDGRFGPSKPISCHTCRLDWQDKFQRKSG